MRRRHFPLLTIIALLLILWVLPVQAQEPQPSDDEVNAIAKQLYCPVCENIPLDVCPTAACEQWRATISEKLTQGWDEAQIKSYFVDQYGDRVLASPPATGLNWLVYILPPVTIVLGSVILFRAMRTWTKASERVTPETQASGSFDKDPYIAQFEEQLRERERR
jgi:cytochrome c-type biogenesis protein CcmH